MSRYITELAEIEIVGYLNEWAEGQYGKKLTWKLLENTFGYSRQSMNKNVAVKQAYHAAKESLRLGANPRSSQEQLWDRLKKAEQRIKNLEKIKERYEERWVIWRYNAGMHGLTEDELNRPMEKGFKDAQRG